MIEDPTQNFGLCTVSLDGHVTIALTGELDLATAPQLAEELALIPPDGTELLTLDLSGLTFVDSTGLSTFVAAFKQLGSQGVGMVLRSPTASTRRVLEISGLDKLLPVIDG
jgi:anti-sigma B factor antagonist